MKWISVKDRLPLENQEVLALFEAGHSKYDIVSYDKEGGNPTPFGNFNWWKMNAEDWADCDPTHWMPLPSPPCDKKDKP